MRLGKPEAPEGIQRFQQRPDVETLASFEQFAQWPRDALALLTDQIELQQMRPGSILFDLGANDQMDYFLLDGQVDLVASDGRRAEITAGSDRAQSVISRLRPRKFKAEVVLPTLLIAVDRQSLSDWVKRADRLSDMRVLDVRDPNLATNAAYLNFTADLSSHKLFAYVPADLRAHLKLALEHANAKTALSLINQDGWLSARLALVEQLTQATASQDTQEAQPLSADALRAFVDEQPLASFKTAECERIWRKRYHEIQLTAELTKALAVRGRMNAPNELRVAALQAQLGELALIYCADQAGQAWDQSSLSELIRTCGPSANQLLATEWKLSAQAKEFSATTPEHPDASSDAAVVYALARLHAAVGDEEGATPAWHRLGFFEHAASRLGLSPAESLDMLENCRGQVELRVRASA